MYSVRPAALAALVLIAAQASSSAATVLPARIEANATWTKANSPYELHSNVFIAAGAKVTVESGVTVRAMGEYLLTIAGEITARADAGERIVFRALNADPAGAWRGLYFTDGSTGFFQRCDFRQGQDNILADSANLQLYNCQVRLASRDGVYVWGDTWFRSSRTTFQNNGRYGLQVQTSRVRGAVTFSRFVGNGEYPCLMKATCAEMLHGGNYYASNGKQMIGVDCGSLPDIEDRDRWRDQLLPYDLTAGPENAELEIAAGAQQKIEAGVRVIPPRRILVRGRLVAEGLSQQRIVMTPAGTPDPGDWLGIEVQRNGFAWLRFVTIGWARNGVTINDAPVYLRNVLVRDCELDGVYMGGTARLDAMDTSFADCGRSGVRAPQPSSSGKIVNCSFARCDDYPVYAAATWLEALRSGNTYADNAKQLIGAACNQDTDIEDQDAWLPQGIAYDLTSSDQGTYLKITAGGRLTLRAGTRVVGGGIGSAGTFVAAGTVAKPIALTSPSATPAPGDWLGVEFLPGGGGRLTHAVVSYAQTGCAIASDRGIRIEHSTLRHCLEDGVRLSGSAVAVVKYCSIYRNGEMGINVTGNARPGLGNQWQADNPGQNSLYNNGQYDLANNTASALRAENNWWDETTAAGVRTRIYDAEDNGALGAVDFSPFLSTQPAGLLSAPASSDEAPLVIMSVAATSTGVGAAIQVSLSRPAALRVTIRNIAGRTVREISAQAERSTVVTWDRTSALGTAAPAGRYLVEVQALADDGSLARVLTPLSLR